MEKYKNILQKDGKKILGFRNLGLRFGFWGFGFGIRGIGSRIRGSGFRNQSLVFCFRVQGLFPFKNQHFFSLFPFFFSMFSEDAAYFEQAMTPKSLLLDWLRRKPMEWWFTWMIGSFFSYFMSYVVFFDAFVVTLVREALAMNPAKKNAFRRLAAAHGASEGSSQGDSSIGKLQLAWQVKYNIISLKLNI